MTPAKHQKDCTSWYLVSRYSTGVHVFVGKLINVSGFLHRVRILAKLWEISPVEYVEIFCQNHESPPGRFVNSGIVLLVAFNLSKNPCQLGNASGATSLADNCRGHHNTNLLIREIHQKHHTFVLFDPSQMGPIEWPLKCQKKPWTVAHLLLENQKMREGGPSRILI